MEPVRFIVLIKILKDYLKRDINLKNEIMNTEKLSNENKTEALNKHVVMQGLPLRDLLDDCWRSAFTAFLDCYKTKTEFNSETEFNKYYAELSTKLKGSPTVASEGQGEANTCADFWCQNEMYDKPRCSEICTWCHGYRRG